MVRSNLNTWRNSKLLLLIVTFSSYLFNSLMINKCSNLNAVRIEILNNANINSHQKQTKSGMISISCQHDIA